MPRRDITGWLPNLLGPVDFQVGGVKVSVPRRGMINLSSGCTVEDDADNNRTNLTFAGGGGGGSPGAPDKTFQTRTVGGGGFTALEFHTREDVGRAHLTRAAMTGSPELIIGTHTITRGSGSWITEGFVAGPIFIRNIQSPYQTANNGLKTVTSVSATVLTVSETLTADDIGASDVLGDAVTLEQGGYQTIGLVGQVLPDQGERRATQLATFEPSRVIDSHVDGSGNTIVDYAIDRFGNVTHGSTFDEANSAAGVTKLPSILAVWSELNIDHSDSIERRDRSSVSRRAKLIESEHDTSSATPVTILNVTPNATYRLPRVHVTVYAYNNVNAARWEFEGDVFDLTSLNTPTRYYATAGAAAWTCVYTGEANVVFTGAAATNIHIQSHAEFLP